MTVKRKRGRPRKQQEAKRAFLGLRTTHELKDKIGFVATANGRSISQEAELRLERSFLKTEMMWDFLEMLKEDPKVVGAIVAALKGRQ